LDRFLDVDLFIDSDRQKWEAKFRDITQLEPIGDISGSLEGKIKHQNTKRIFTISSSELGSYMRGKGYGLLMYELTIKKILSIWPNSEIHSSNQLNQYSKGVWDALCREYGNVNKVGRHYEIKPMKVL
jgi:hypothetical protein